MASPTGKTADFQNALKSFSNLRTVASIHFEQSPVGPNGEPSANVGIRSMSDAMVFLNLGPDNYWMFARYRAPSSGKKQKGKKAAALPPLEAKPATLEGFDIPLLTTPL